MAGHPPDRARRHACPDAARPERGETQHPLTDGTGAERDEAGPHRLGRTPTEQHQAAADPAAGPAPRTDRTRTRRRHGLLLVSAAVAVALAALVTMPRVAGRAARYEADQQNSANSPPDQLHDQRLGRRHRQGALASAGYTVNVRDL
jgi:hypothetical protein